MIDLKLMQNGEDFEFFCRDLLAGLGITILQGPSRGPDGKKDFIIQVETENAFGKIEIDKYLVQCKHKAKSNRAIYENDLGDIRSACNNNNVNGYLLITSTIPGVSVQNNLIAIQNEPALYPIELRRLDDRFSQSPSILQAFISEARGQIRRVVRQARDAL